MYSILMLEEADRGEMLSAKWIDHSGVVVAVCPAAACVRMLSHPLHIIKIKSKEMQAKRKENTLVERNGYATYSMANVPPLPEYEIVLKKGKFNGIRAYYNICTDPDLGLGWAAVCWVTYGCVACKAQLKTGWKLRVDNSAQPRYARNKECKLWPSYEVENN